MHPSVGREAVTGDQQPDGLGEDAGVEGGAAAFDVIDIELDPLLPGNAGASLHLGPAGDAGADLVAAMRRKHGLGDASPDG